MGERPRTGAVEFCGGVGCGSPDGSRWCVGAVFLLPIQLTVLDVPSPAVTPTNLLFNIVAIPGALARYRGTATEPADADVVCHELGTGLT